MDDCVIADRLTTLLIGPGGAAAFEVRRLDRIGQPLPQLFAASSAGDRRPPAASADRASDAGSTSSIATARAVDEQPREALSCGGVAMAAATRAGRDDRSVRRAVGAHRRRCVGPSGLGGLGQLVDLRRVRRRPTASDDRQVEAEQQPRARRAARRAAARRLPPSRARLRGRSCGRTSARRARTAAACSRESRSSCRRSTADCGCCSSGGSRSPARCRRCDRRRASPSARGTAARRPTATRRIGAALRRRSCRRRATTSRPADAGDDDQLAERQRQIDILEVVRARAADDEIGGFPHRSGCHSQLSWRRCKPPIVAQRHTRGNQISSVFSPRRSWRSRRAE